MASGRSREGAERAASRERCRLSRGSGSARFLVSRGGRAARGEVGSAGVRRGAPDGGGCACRTASCPTAPARRHAGPEHGEQRRWELGAAGGGARVISHPRVTNHPCARCRTAGSGDGGAGGGGGDHAGHAEGGGAAGGGGAGEGAADAGEGEGAARWGCPAEGEPLGFGLGLSAVPPRR